MEKRYFLFLLLFMSALCNAFADIPFYIKQEQPQLPGESLEVRAKGSNRPITFTVFRIKDPRSFLKGQENIHKLKIEDTPIREELNQALALSKAASRPKIHGKVASVDLDRLNYEYARSFATTVSADPQSFDGYVPVPLGIKESGLYLVEAVQDRYVAYCLALCTDLAMITKRSQGRIIAYLAHRKTGQPREGVSVFVYRKDRSLVHGTTNAQGIFEAQVPYFPQITIMAQEKENFTPHDPSFFPSLVAHYKAYVFTERPLYLPGEEVFFKGILREWKEGEYGVPKATGEEVEYEIKSERGIVQKGKVPVEAEALFSGRFELPQECALGKYTMLAKWGRHLFSTEFRVEKFQKPQFLVQVAPTKRAMVMGEKAHFEIAARYYSGGKVESGEVRYQLYRSRFHQPLFQEVGLESFYSKGEYQSFKAELVTTGSLPLKEGKGEISFDTPQSDFNYYYRLQATVIDPSRSVADGSGSVEISRAAIKMDMKANKELYAVEDQIMVTVKAMDILNRPVSCDFKLELIRKGRQYPKGGSASPWRDEIERMPEVQARKIGEIQGKTDANGIATLETPASEAGEIDLRLSALDPMKNLISVEKTVWVGQGDQPILYSGDTIRLVPDKKAYQVGETAQVMVVLPVRGISPLITVEGTEILSYQVKHFSDNATVLSVPITESMSPNVYLKVSAIYRNGFMESEQMLVVPPVRRMITLDIMTDSPSYGPGQEVALQIKATDYQGNPVETDFALGVVDNALYALASDQNAPLHQFFYSLRRTNVGSDSSILLLSYDYARESARLPQPVVKEDKAEKKKMEMDNGGSEERESPREMAESPRPEPTSAPRSEEAAPRQRAVRAERPALGNGDPEKKQESKPSSKPESPSSERTLFKTTAAWFAMVRTNAEGTAKVTFTFPDNLTDWKMTARAVDERTRIGELRTDVSTRKPVMVSLQRPAFLIEKDRVKLEISARNGTEEVQRLALSMKASASLALSQPISLSQDVASGQWMRTQAEITAMRPGKAELHCSVKAHSESDAMKQTLSVFPHGIRQSRGTSGILQQPTTRLPGHEFLLPSQCAPETTQLVVRLYPGYLGAIQDALDLLMEYPYGCTEQTLSRFMPNLVAARVFQNLEVKAASRSNLERFVQAGLSRLYRMQNQDGGWGWWNDGSQGMMSAYVMAGLGRAHALGYPIENGVLERGIPYLKKKIEDPSIPYAEKAYLLYALALNRAMPVTLADQIFDRQERTQADPYTLSLLALSLVEVDRKPEAKIVVQEIAQKARLSGDQFPYWGNLEAHRWDKDAVEVTAMAIRAILSLDPSHELIGPALKWLMSQRVEEGWGSTKATAEAVLTLCAYLEEQKKKEAEGEQNVTVMVNQAIQKVAMKDRALACSFHASTLKEGKNEITMLCDRPGEIFYTATLSYFTPQLPIPASAFGFAVKRQYTLLSEARQGDKMVYRKSPLPEMLSCGDLVMVELNLEVSKGHDFVMLSDALPATAMVVKKDREIEVEGEGETLSWTHREFHDEKTVFFFTHLRPGTYRLRYFFRTVLAGHFHALPAEASLMYYPEVKGNSEESIFRVK